MRAIRGAITVEENTKDAIGKATRELLRSMMRENQLTTDDIISVIFTITSDLNAVFPAATAREMTGWNYIPMLCALEMDVPGSLSKCIRILIHADITADQRDIHHVYLGDAVRLRPDLYE